MASLCGKVALNVARRNALCGSRRFATKVTMGDPVEHSTGLEKREYLSKIAGNENPFDLKVIKRGAGTKGQPNEIPSAFDARLVGCICEEEATNVTWMWLHKGQPRRCECGHWFNLVQKAPL
ncbi:PREDICTED: cytochrome c oxidase subunit 5B, mitochondrial-like [Nicrophorus vespilloides]|uniref:Cytochrome c oxidase subunit 5B, mitochondrial-like n=1 Tax=Nicrophorus vespilloides TaxID=110193 RepID=A0ABM1M3R6_NICVS|nr:PREDICTED: cytochrome c oxidase subunit 5B, mitochondrial-like [Nicrophorus vespilloides]